MTRKYGKFKRQMTAVSNLEQQIKQYKKDLERAMANNNEHHTSRGARISYIQDCIARLNREMLRLAAKAYEDQENSKNNR